MYKIDNKREVGTPDPSLSYVYLLSYPNNIDSANINLSKVSLIIAK